MRLNRNPVFKMFKEAIYHVVYFTKVYFYTMKQYTITF